MGVGTPTNRRLGGTGKKQGKVRVCFLAKSPAWERDRGHLGMQEDSRVQAAVIPAPIT